LSVWASKLDYLLQGGLRDHAKAAPDFYPGRTSHGNHDIAAKQMQGFGGALSFTLKDGSDSVRRFLPRLNDAHLAANLGAVETVVDHPTTTRHVECTLQERTAMAIPEGLIRYSAGIENTEDLVDDLGQALSARK
jgi:cystathionine gamma-synthase